MLGEPSRGGTIAVAGMAGLGTGLVIAALLVAVRSGHPAAPVATTLTPPTTTITTTVTGPAPPASTVTEATPLPVAVTVTSTETITITELLVRPEWPAVLQAPPISTSSAPPAAP